MNFGQVSDGLAIILLVILVLHPISTTAQEVTMPPNPDSLHANLSENEIVVYDISDRAIARVYAGKGNLLASATYHRGSKIGRSHVKVPLAIKLQEGTVVYVSVQDEGKAESSRTPVNTTQTHITGHANAYWKGEDLKVEITYSSLMPSNVISVDASQFTLARDITDQSIQAASAVNLSLAGVAVDPLKLGTYTSSSKILITFTRFPEQPRDSDGFSNLYLRYNQGEKSKRVRDDFGGEVKSIDSIMVPIPSPSSKTISSLSFEGVIIATSSRFDMGNSLVYTVPFGTDITVLKPIISHTGTSISPSSGVVQDFTEPVVYTVTATDGSKQACTVTVIVEERSANSIYLFSLSTIKPIGNVYTTLAYGQINQTEKAISLRVPYGTDITKLKPIISHTGTSISPASGTEQDFTQPIVYTVKAGDGTSQDYIVNVTVTGYTAKSIDNFILLDQNMSFRGNINESDKKITVNVPPGTNLTTLKHVYSFIGASVTPATGVIQDFTKPVTYTVTAADGSKQDYTVVVSFAVAPTPQPPQESHLPGDEEHIVDYPKATPRILQATVGVDGYTLSGKFVPMTACYYRGSDTMMPIRMLDEFGISLDWNEQQKRLTLVHKEKTVVLTIGSTNAVINGVTTPIRGASGQPIAPELSQGRVMIPLRFVSETLGFRVEWTPDNIIRIYES